MRVFCELKRFLLYRGTEKVSSKFSGLRHLAFCECDLVGLQILCFSLAIAMRLSGATVISRLNRDHVHGC